jgi:hypothetical protein
VLDLSRQIEETGHILLVGKPNDHANSLPNADSRR